MLPEALNSKRLINKEVIFIRFEGVDDHSESTPLMQEGGVKSKGGAFWGDRGASEAAKFAGVPIGNWSQSWVHRGDCCQLDVHARGAQVEGHRSRHGAFVTTQSSYLLWDSINSGSTIFKIYSSYINSIIKYLKLDELSIDFLLLGEDIWLYKLEKKYVNLNLN